MAKKKRDTTIKSINFDRLILQALEHMCERNGITVSSFVNNLVKGQLFHKEKDFELEFVREITKQKAADFQFWKTHLDALSPDIKIKKIKKQKIEEEKIIKPKMEIKKKQWG